MTQTTMMAGVIPISKKLGGTGLWNAHLLSTTCPLNLHPESLSFIFK